MKYAILLFCLCLSQFCLFAADTYEVYQVYGTVKIKKNNKWVSLSKGSIISLKDKVQIANGSKLVVVKLPARSLYESLKSGEMLISEIKDDAIKHSNEIFGLTLRELYGKDNNGQTFNKGSVYGVTTRDAEVLDNTFEGVILANIKKTISVMMSGCDFDVSGFDNEWMYKITAISVIEGKSRYFILSNASEKLMFVNVVCVNLSNNSVSVLYNEITHPLGVMVPAGKTLSLNMYKFDACNQCKYFIFGTENSFDVAELCKMVNMLNVSLIKPNDEKPSNDYKLGTVLIK